MGRSGRRVNSRLEGNRVKREEKRFGVCKIRQREGERKRRTRTKNQTLDGVPLNREEENIPVKGRGLGGDTP